MRRERRPSPWLRGLLLFLLGALVGANAVYFVMTPRRAPACRSDAAGARRDADCGRCPCPPTVAQHPRPLHQRAGPPAAAAAAAVRATGVGAGTMPRLEQPACCVPVQGVTAAQLQDTFTDARSEGRVARRHRHHGAGRHAGARGRRRPRREAVRQQARRLTLYQFNPEGTLRLLLRAPAGLRRRHRREAAAQARPGDRLRRHHRQRQSRWRRTCISRSSSSARSSSGGRARRSIPYPLLRGDAR